MKLSNLELLVKANLVDEVLAFVEKSEQEKQNLEAFCKVFDQQSEIIKASIGNAFTSRFRGVLGDIKAVAESKWSSYSINNVVKEFNARLWMGFLEVIKPAICSKAIEILKDTTHWAKEVPVFSEEIIIEKLNSIADLQGVADELGTVLNTLKDQYGFNGDIAEGIRVKDLDLDCIDQLNSIVYKYWLNTVFCNKHRKEEFLKNAQKSIKPELEQQKNIWGKMKNEAIEVKFYKNGNVEVRTALGDQINGLI